MIVLGEKRENLNIIHLIMGPETEFQFDMSGQCIIDITEHCKQNAVDGHMILVLNKCQSEEKLAEKLKEIHGEESECTDESCDCHKEENKKKEDKKEKNAEQPSVFKCPGCGETGKGILKNGIVMKCKICQKIDEGITKHEISENPSNDQLKTIISDMIKNKPEEFKLLCEKIYIEPKKKVKTNVK